MSRCCCCSGCRNIEARWTRTSRFYSFCCRWPRAAARSRRHRCPMGVRAPVELGTLVEKWIDSREQLNLTHQLTLTLTLSLTLTLIPTLTLTLIPTLTLTRTYIIIFIFLFLCHFYSLSLSLTLKLWCSHFSHTSPSPRPLTSPSHIFHYRLSLTQHTHTFHALTALTHATNSQHTITQHTHTHISYSHSHRKLFTARLFYSLCHSLTLSVSLSFMLQISTNTGLLFCCQIVRRLSVKLTRLKNKNESCSVNQNGQV